MIREWETWYQKQGKKLSETWDEKRRDKPHTLKKECSLRTARDYFLRSRSRISKNLSVTTALVETRPDQEVVRAEIFSVEIWTWNAIAGLDPSIEAHLHASMLKHRCLCPPVTQEKYLHIS